MTAPARFKAVSSKWRKVAPSLYFSPTLHAIAAPFSASTPSILHTTIPPSGVGQVAYWVTCTELGDHVIQGACLATGQYVLLNVRVTHIELSPDPMYNNVLEVPQNTYCTFSVADYLGHNCCIFGFDGLNPDYSGWVPSGVGGTAGTPLCTEADDHTITGYCLATGLYDQTVVRVLPVDIKPDRGPSGFHQINKNGTVTFTVRVQAGHHCAIFGLDTVNPAYTSVPTGYGSCRFEAICVTKGDHTIQGSDLITGESDQTVLRVSEIAQTAWESILGTLDTNPNAGGGKRIFPDWVLSDFPNGPSPPRSWVQVHSTVDPPPADPNQPFTVRFAHWDVDDPSANQLPVDNEATGPDNRGLGWWQMAGGGGGNWSEVPVTVAGHGGSVFAVSPQPGDNFRVNAQIVGEAMYGIAVPQGVTDGRINRSDTGQPPRTEEVTPMLTVWRKICIEIDKLSAPASVAANPTWAEGTIVGATYFAPQNQTALIVNGVPAAGRTNELYTGGGIKAGGQASAWGIVAFVYPGSDIGHPYVPGNQTGSVSAGHQMADDDHNYAQSGFPLKVTFPLAPDTGYLATVFAPAYIVPDLSAVAQYNQTIAFDAEQKWNMSYGSFKGYSTSYCGSRGLGRSLFWCGYILGAFQSSASGDGDPDSEEFAMGYTDSTENKGSVAFLETYRDLSAWMVARGMAPKPLSWVTAHEVGHQFSLCHTVGSYQEAPVHGGGHVLAKNGNVLTLEGQLNLLGFNYNSGVLRTRNYVGGAVLSESRIVSYTNDPQTNQCSVAISPISGTPAVGQYYEVYENSIMCGKFTYWSFGYFSPRDLSDLRQNSESPLRIP